MNSYVQLICLVLSLFYGLFIYLVFNICNKMVKNKNVVIKFLVNSLLIIIMSFLYVFLIYKINCGIISPYFYLLILFGFVLPYVKKRKI